MLRQLAYALWTLAVFPFKLVASLLFAHPSRFIEDVVSREPWATAASAAYGVILSCVLLMLSALPDSVPPRVLAEIYLVAVAYLAGCAATGVVSRRAQLRRPRSPACVEDLPVDTLTVGQTLGLLAGLLPAAGLAVTLEDTRSGTTVPIYYITALPFIVGALSGLLVSRRLGTRDEAAEFVREASALQQRRLERRVQLVSPDDELPG